jgi:hypothetical protein
MKKILSENPVDPNAPNPGAAQPGTTAPPTFANVVGSGINALKGGFNNFTNSGFYKNAVNPMMQNMSRGGGFAHSAINALANYTNPGSYINGVLKTPQDFANEEAAKHDAARNTNIDQLNGMLKRGELKKDQHAIAVQKAHQQYARDMANAYTSRGLNPTGFVLGAQAMTPNPMQKFAGGVGKATSWMARHPVLTALGGIGFAGALNDQRAKQMGYGYR